MNNQAPVFVATYGSLRTGQSNFRVNLRAGAESIGLGWTAEPYQLARYSTAYFPMVSLGVHAGNRVRVEVFKTTQAGLEGPYDSLEGYPGFYDRTEVMIDMDDGSKVKAWIYHIEDQNRAGEVVTHGDWAEYLGGSE